MNRSFLFALKISTKNLIECIILVILLLPSSFLVEAYVCVLYKKAMFRRGG